MTPKRIKELRKIAKDAVWDNNTSDELNETLDEIMRLRACMEAASPAVVKALVAEVREKDERLAALEKQLAGLRCRKDKGARERDKTLEDVVDLMEALKASLGAGKRGRRF